MTEETAILTQSAPPPTPGAPKDAPIAPEARDGRKETFAEKWARHGGDVGDLKEDRGDAEPTNPQPPVETTPETAKPPDKIEPEPEKPAHPQNTELAQLKELAKKLGLTFDGGRITSAEQAAFREFRRKQRAQLDEERTTAEREIQEHRQTLAQELETATKLFKARDDGDWNSLAQVLGFDDFTAFQREVAARVSDPNYRRMRDLEDWKAKQELAEQERQQREEQTRIEQEERQAIDSYKVQLAEHMSGSQHPVLKALGRQSFFVNAIHAIQRAEYDGSTTVTAEQALMMPAPGSSVPLLQELRAIYEPLHQAFGGGQPTSGMTPSPSQITKQAKDAADASSVKSAPIPPSSGSQASAPRKAPTDRREFAKYMQEKLDEADLQERMANRNREPNA